MVSTRTGNVIETGKPIEKLKNTTRKRIIKHV